MTEYREKVYAGAESGGPSHLPYAAYPTTADVAWHGLQPLPEYLPIVDFERAEPYRGRYSTVVATELAPEQLLQMAWVIADSFAKREPQARHLRPPKSPPAGLMEMLRTDPFGTDSFGSWDDAATHLYWIIRLLALTDPTSPEGAIEINKETLSQSVAILDGEGSAIIGGAFNETMGPFDEEPPFREDPILGAVMGVWEAVYAQLGAQDAESLSALSERYPEFRKAYEEGKVGHHLLVARSDDLPKEDAFELVAASAERYRDLGYEYMVTEATNQWTGAAFEALGGARVHFGSLRRGGRGPPQANRPRRLSGGGPPGSDALPGGFGRTRSGHK
ncbi:MAG: hypothetical protein ACRDSJ_06445, partial [Rubrobacteraceae bacterium]